MKALLLLLAFVACAYASCPVENYVDRYVYGRGRAVVKVPVTGGTEEVTKGLRVEVVANSPWNPNNLTVLASVDADGGYFMIAAKGGCYPEETYGLRLFAEALSPSPLIVHRTFGGPIQFHDTDQIEIDEKIVTSRFFMMKENMFYMEFEGRVP